MPIFDNELINNVSNRESSAPEMPLGSPETFTPDTHINLQTGEPVAKTGLSLDELGKINVANKNTFDSPFQMVTKGELLDNKRYALYSRGEDLENIYGVNQNWAKQLGNGIVKMAGTAIGTFAQSFATIPDTVSAIKNKDFSKLSGDPNGFEGTIDNWTKNMENYFPNYVTRKEKESPYLAMIPGFAGSANFWGNSIIKNLGFTVGAIGGALVQDAAIGAITGGVGDAPLIANQLGKVSLFLNKLFSGSSRAAEFIADIKTLGLAAEKEAFLVNFATTKVGNSLLKEGMSGIRYGMNLYGSARTEAGVEGRDGYRQVKEDLINHYKITTGEAPTGAELDKIEQYATDAMNTRFGINMALLTVSNAIQFDSLFKSFSTASRGVRSSIVRDIEEAGKIGLKEGSLNEFEIKAPLTIKGKIWDAVKPKLPTILSEGVYEEGGQFAAEKGVTDYYTRKYKNKGDWNELNEVIKSTTTGLKEQFGSQEGIENMLVGGISALISGGILNRVNTIKGQGKDVQLQRALNSLNAYGLTGMLDQKYENTGNSVAIAKEMQQAAQEGNILKYKNLKHDQFFNFVMSRIPSGMHDVTIEQLEMLKGLSKEDFEKTFGMDFSTSNKSTVNEYVDQLITNANKIKDNVDSLDAVFKNPFKFTTNPETKEESENNDNYKIFNNWKTDIAYFNSQSSDYNSRLLSMNESLAKINPLVDVSLAKSLLNPESLKNYSQEYEEKAALLESTILPTTSIQDRRAIKEEVKSLRTLSEKINLMLNSKQTDLKLLTSVLNFEINGQDFLQEPQVSSDKVVNILDYSRDINIIDASKKEIAKRIEAMTSKEGFEKYFEPEIIDSTPLAKQEIAKKPYDVGREYENPATKTAKVRKITDGRFKVTAPNGDVTFYKTREEANEIAKDLNKDFSDLAKVKVLAINEDGSIKVEDLAGNIQNIPADFLKEYSGLESDEEKIAKQQAEIDKQQKEIEKKSGTVATGNPDTEDIEPEAAKKAAEKFFKSSITESEDWANPNESAPHVKNAREFLLNAKNFSNRENLRAILVTPNSENKLGLTGLTALSYGTNDSSKSTDAEEGFVAQVFVEQDGSKLFFVDKEGKRIGEVGSPIDVNSVIFQTMPTTSITTSKGKSRARTGEEDKLEMEAKRWKAQRELLFKQDGSKSQAYEFIISRGVPVTSDTENFHVAESLGIPVKLISKTQDLILISTTGFITHNGQNIQFPKGRPVLQYGDTLQPLQNTKITPSESQTIFQCILNISNDILNATKEGKKFNIQGMKETAFLQNILFWGKGQKSANQIYIDGTNLHVGKTSFPLTEIADKQSEIQEAVTGLYRNINNASLKDISVKFREQRFDGKELVEVEWKNYQEYLLSSKNPDGSSRNTTSTPLVTNIVAPTELAPINFKQKYATLEQIEYPQVATPTVSEVKVETPTTNTISIMGQNVPFTYTEEDGNFTVEIQSSEATKVLAENDELVNKYTSTLKSVNLPVADNAEQIIIDFLSLQKAAQLKKAALEKAKEVVAPVIVSTPTTPITTEAKIKAYDKTIEREYEEGDYLKVLSLVQKQVKDGKIDQTPENLQLLANYPNLFKELIKATEARNKTIAEFDKEAVLAGKPKELSIYGIESTINPATGKLDIKWVVVEKQVITNIQVIKVGNYAADMLFAYKDELLNEKETPTTPVSDIEAKKADIRKAIAKAGQGEGGIFKVTLVDGSSFSIPRMNNTTGTDELFDDKGNLIDYSVISKVENPDGEVLYNTKSQVNGAENLTNGEDKTAPLDTKKIKPRDADYMRVGGEEIVSATPEQFEEFKKWHAENVPNIPFEVLENLVNTFDGEKAFGVFEDGVAKFYKGAPGTTAYHEVFEGVWKHFLTLDEKNAIIQELRDSVKDFKDRATGKTLNYATATDEQIKERIADDFAEFKAGKIPAKSLIGKIVDFFRNIMNFFKSFVQKPTLKESLFKEIEKGRFKESKITTVDSNPEYSRVPGLTETQVYELTQDMTALSSFYLFGVDNKRSLYDVAKVTSKELFDWIKGEYVKQDLYEQLGNARWNQLVEYTKENLKTIGVSFKKNEDNIDEETIDINSEGANKNDYDGNPFKQDWKKNSPYAVKLSLLVPKTVYTNQENKTELEIPERQTTSYQGYKLANFNKMFVSLMDKLANTTSVSKFIDKFFNLAKRESDLVVPFKRLGANLDGSIDFSKFKKDDWRLFVDYMRVFTKQRPDAVIQYTNEGSTYIAPANQFTASKNIESQWFEEMKALSSKDGGIIKKDKEKKTYTIDLKDIKLPKTIEETLDFLNEMGINFPMDVYNRLNKKEQTAVLKAGGSIYTYIQSNPTVATLDGKILGINGPLNTLSNIIVKTTNPNIDSTHFNVEGERVGSYTENNFPSEFENIFNETSTLDELLEAMPQLKDVYAQGSQMLKKGGLFFDEDGNRIATIKVGTTGGSKNLNTDKGTSIAKLTLGNRFIQEINNNLQGNYYILIPADGSTEWMLNLGNPVSFIDVQEGRGNNEIVSIFKDYLDSEIELALQDGRSKISNVGSKTKELRFFKEILLEKDVTAIQELLAENDVQGIQDYLKENKESIKSAIVEYFNNNVADLKSNLQNNQQLLGIDGNYSIPNMLSEFLSSNKINNGEISEQTLNDILFFLQANYVIANMEMHKILFGDPYQFKIKNNQLDETKRIKSFLSPRRRTFDSVPFNNFLNTEYNKAQDIELDENEFGYHTHKAYTNTSTLSDVELVGSVALMEDMPEEIRDAYSKTNEADAASFLLDNTYREVKLKNEQWSNEAEEWHQWHLAYARQNMPGYVYVNKELAKQDAITVSKPEPKFIADILKPIVSGVKYNQDFANLVLDKFSQMPLYYKWVQGTNLEKLYLQMHKENKGYVVMISGRKVGSEGEHSIYNTDGAYNESDFNNNIQVPWTAYGIQVENAYEKPKDQTRGSQSVKLVSVDLFEGGKPLGATPERQAVIQKAYDRNNDILDEMHNNAYTNLLSKIGVEDMGDSFKLSNPTVVSETLSNELLRREMNRNDKETIQLDENGEFAIPFEASPAYYKIKSILYSLVNKALISPKLNGAPHVQAPVTLQESGNRKLAIKTETGYKRISQKEYNALTEEQKKKVVLTDDTLKFYTRAEPWCEVLLPHWFREKLGKHANKTDEELIKYLNNHPDGKKILMGIGFRIPTQSVSSMEVFKVKGFLPKSMGYTVIVPSEITTKAGSDFDIDKLNMYLKSIYIDQNGDIQLVKYINNEATTKAFYAKVYENTIQKDIDKLSKFDEFRDQLFNVFSQLESLEEFTLESIKTALSEKNFNFYKNHTGILQEIINQAAEENINPSAYIQEQILTLGSTKEKLTSKLLNDSLKEKYANDMYKKALENEYYESMQELLSLPETFDRLLSPVSDGGLKDLAATISELRNDTENNIKTRMLNRTYLTKLRHAFVTGKRWVGIAAVNITSHSIFQKSDVYVDPSRFSEVPKRDQVFLGDGSVILPHNKNSKGLPSLSGMKTAKGNQTISDRLSGYATAFVDIAKDPYIMKLVKSNSVVGTFMFLERLGCGEMGVKFLNQPIISEYLDYLDATDQKGLFNKDNIGYIKSLFPTTEQSLKNSEIDLKNLDSNISNYYINNELQKGSDQSNAEQQHIFDEFLKYAKMAEYNFKITQAINYDTTRFGSGDALTRKQVKTRQAKNNIISDVNEIINNSFLKTQSELLDKSMNSMGAILKLEERTMRDITDEILIPYAEKDFMPDDDFDNISNKIKLSFLDYLVQTKSGINDDINTLLLEASGNIQEQLSQAKKAHPEMQILKDLQIESSKRIGGAKTIKLAVNTKEAFEEDNYISMMEELKDIEPELYNSIVKISILQGAAQTAVSIKNIIPLADYAKIVSPIINTLSNTEDVKAFSKGAFQRSNWNDDSIVPKVDSLYFKALNEGQEYEIVDKYGNVSDYYSLYSSPAFISGKNLGFTGKQLLALDEFNALSKGDFIKIPRIVNVRGTTENVDILTNRSVSNFALRKKAAMGDFSFKDYYGYQLVRDATGEPVTKIETNYKGEQYTKYIYKQINLYGDGKYTAEYRMDTKPSAINNGTVKVEQELPDSMLIQEYGGISKVQENVVPLPSTQQAQSVSSEADDVLKQKEQESKKCNQ